MTKTSKKTDIASTDILLPTTLKDAFGECPNWCVYAGLHTLNEPPSDRFHYGAERRLDLAFSEGEHDEATGDWQPSYCTVYLSAQPPGNEPLVFVGQMERVGINLTLDEAERYVDVLLSVIAQGREEGS